MMAGPVIISAAVEGIVDEAAVRKLIEHVGGIPGPVYGKSGKITLRQKISGYNNAAKRSPWLVLVDLDRDQECVPPFRKGWIPKPAPYMCFRVAVRAIEAWLLADRTTMASFLAVPSRRIPHDVETLENPKRTLVELARQSRRRIIRQDMAPREGSGRSIGAAYPSRVIEYIEDRWRPEVAARFAESLERAMACLEHQIRSWSREQN